MLMPGIFGENLFDEFFDDFAYPAKLTVPKKEAKPAIEESKYITIEG